MATVTEENVTIETVDGQEENLDLSSVNLNVAEDEPCDSNSTTVVKKKKKKKNKPKKGGEGGGDKGVKQTVPPSIPISQLFSNEDYPIGEIMDYPKVENDKCVIQFLFFFFSFFFVRCQF